MASADQQKLLKQIRIRNRKQCYIYSLPTQISSTNETLSYFKEQFKALFSQFGTVFDISFVDNKAGLCVLVTYPNNEATVAAIKWTNRIIVNFDGLYWRFKARFGQQKYCTLFIKNKQCFDTNCPFIHQFSYDTILHSQSKKWNDIISGEIKNFIGIDSRERNNFEHDLTKMKIEIVGINIHRPKSYTHSHQTTHTKVYKPNSFAPKYNCGVLHRKGILVNKNVIDSVEFEQKLLNNIINDDAESTHSNESISLSLSSLTPIAPMTPPMTPTKLETPKCITDVESDTEVLHSENEGQIKYEVSDLVALQKDFTETHWQTLSDVPTYLRFASSMEHIIAMFHRKSRNPWLAPSHTGISAKDKKEKLIKKLTGVLNKMTPEKFGKIAKSVMDIVNEYAETKNQMHIIIGLVLQFGIKQPVFGGQYALLCSHLHAHLPKLAIICDYEWVTEAKGELSQIVRKMVIHKTDELFNQYFNSNRNYSEKANKNNFFAVMVLIGELYNVDLIKKKIILRAVFDELLRKESICSVHLEGMCRLLKRCGKRMDNECEKYLDKYLKKIMRCSKEFDFRTRVLCEDISEMRDNEWQFRLKKETAKTKDEIKEEFDIEQSMKHINIPKKRVHKKVKIMQSYGDSGMIRKVKACVSEYLVSGVIDDLMDLKCSDFKVWASVINDGLRDRKSAQISGFIQFVLALFDKRVLSDGNGEFVHIIVKYLVIQMDESSVDCPSFGKYLGQLFANLCANQWLSVNVIFDYFIAKYKEYSEFDPFGKRRSVNKLIKSAVNELQRLQARPDLIDKLQKKQL